MTTPRPHTVRTEDKPAAPADFFEPGARYVDGDGFKAPEETHTFQCEHIALHPRPGAGPRAFGFARNNAPDSEWFSTALTPGDFADAEWTRIPEDEVLGAPTGDAAPAAPATP
ncbi:hypothetical protein K388_07151 [Streptomyces sp. KhCrAH-43]|uniref:Uncharacterized protein n=1 Tax=Streptomyces tropicalis TaxID=3034234 RepID=A0ABT6AEI1_9ACTN|nr:MULTISPECIES: hypothetical protein [Streptomyces]MDF3303058.1 hypothetical protein [Streptomyces tropicalis]MYS33471.1 hypothetical protein [Streptomyces sp. SID4920]MYX63714.1 hypothetical protein [Streptomyces sp. SID8373]RAJ47806.1 hypothetical protein K388_07151 [Streptomyces sp. KhCrAH-43]